MTFQPSFTIGEIQAYRKDLRAQMDKIKNILLETRLGEPEINTSCLHVEFGEIEILFKGFDPEELSAWVERLKDRIGMRRWEIERFWQSMGYNKNDVPRTRIIVKLSNVAEVMP